MLAATALTRCPGLDGARTQEEGRNGSVARLPGQHRLGPTVDNRPGTQQALEGQVEGQAVVLAPVVRLFQANHRHYLS